MFIVIFLASLVHGAPKDAVAVFGDQLYVHSSDGQIKKQLKKHIEDRKESYQSEFDPDCYYKELGNKSCGRKENKDMVELVASLKKETKGHFDVYDRTTKKRDFGGIAQGYVLNELAQKYNKGWYGNFAGDIFIAPEAKMQTMTYITEPMMDPLPFAIVDMPSGWVISSTAAKYGARMRTKSSETEFDKIVLFAKPEFNGARLDAWSTALISGGKDLLRHLWDQKQFKDQWAYLYFESGAGVTCSSNIDCDFQKPKTRTVRVSWNKGAN